MGTDLENLMGTHWETDPKTKDFPPHLSPQNPKERTKPPPGVFS